MLTAVVLFFALYSTTVDEPATLYSFSSDGEQKKLFSFPSSSRSSWSVQQVKVDGDGLYIYDGNSGVNNIGNSENVFFFSNGNALSVLNVTRYDCLLNDLLVTKKGAVAVCGLDAGGVLVFKGTRFLLLFHGLFLSQMPLFQWSPFEVGCQSHPGPIHLR